MYTCIHLNIIVCFSALHLFCKKRHEVIFEIGFDGNNFQSNIVLILYLNSV